MEACPGLRRVCGGDGVSEYEDKRDIAYLKQQISDCKPALTTPEWENTDEYQCRCDAIQNYYEKKSDLKYRFGIDFEGD